MPALIDAWRRKEVGSADAGILGELLGPAPSLIVPSSPFHE
jgi:hypothetical protein